jgi:ABC-type Fe3+/spermidine/putrescine transport system ATPase subunit
MLLSIEKVAKSYPDLPVLEAVSFGVDSGEIVCILGPSGCGKTTLLRLIAGLEMPDSGRILLDGQDLAPVPVHNRNFGLMFQDFALFPHRNVSQNVGFGLRMQRRDKNDTEARVTEMLELVELRGYESRKVLDLSGGEQQRVALARSLAPRPRLLMLDEPLGSLDRTLREQLMVQLRSILKRVGVTAIYVTHDQEEAFAIADRVVIMRAPVQAGEGGRVEQAGAPQLVYSHPVNAAVARFLGFRNLIPGVVTQFCSAVLRDGAPVGGVVVRTEIGMLLAADVQFNSQEGDQITVLIRPEAASLVNDPDGAPNVVEGALVELSFRGSYYLATTAHGDRIRLFSELVFDSSQLPSVGQPLRLQLNPRAITLLPADERLFASP